MVGTTKVAKVAASTTKKAANKVNNAAKENVPGYEKASDKVAQGAGVMRNTVDKHVVGPVSKQARKAKKLGAGAKKLGADALE